MRALLEGMLELSRQDGAPGRGYRNVPLRLGDEACSAANRASPRADFLGDVVGVIECDHGVPVRADPRALGRVLDNIINNAMTHGRHPAQIKLVVAREGGRGRISVVDGGDGVPEEVRRSLFQGRGFTDSMRGAGLGLLLSSRLMRKMGGTLSFETMMEFGPAVVISLPLAN